MTEHTSGTARAAFTDAPTPALDASLFTPAPGAAPMRRMIAAQAGMELRVMLRHGEQLVLVPGGERGQQRIEPVQPGVYSTGSVFLMTSCIARLRPTMP